MGVLRLIQKWEIRKLKKRGQWGLSQATELIPDLVKASKSLLDGLEEGLHGPDPDESELKTAKPLD